MRFVLSFVTLILVQLPLTAFSQSTWPIQHTNSYCVLDGEYTDIAKVRFGELRVLNFERKLDRMEGRLNLLERRLDRAEAIGNYNKLRVLERRFNRFVLKYNSCLDCYYYEGDGDNDSPWWPGDGNDDEPDWGGDQPEEPVQDPPTPPSPPSGSACEVFTGPSTRIINGESCSGISPVVQLRIDGEVSCTGTLVRSNFVVTAAHCVSEWFNTLEVVTGGESSTVASYYVHPNYGNDEQHDIAVLVLSHPLSAPLMPLLEPDGTSAGVTAAIAGYGEDEGGSYGTLKAGFLAVGEVSTNSIVGYYNGLNSGEDSNTCYGDSGGPLAVQLNGSWHLAGVTSSGSNDSCGRDGNVDHSTFCRVGSSSNLAFVKQHMP